MPALQRPPLPPLPDGVRRYVRECAAIDTRTLAVFRVLMGLIVISDPLLRARNFTYFYTDNGVFPRELAMERTSDLAVSVYYFTSDPTVIAALFAFQVLVGLALVLGYRTRTAAVLSLLLVVSLDHRNPLVLSYADTLFRLLLLWAVFLPLAERWSIDAVHADRAPRPVVSSLATAAILVQMVYMYFVNGQHKYTNELWTSGDATVLIFGLGDMTFLLADVLRNFPTLLVLGGTLWFYILLLSPLLLLTRGRRRYVFATLFFGGHAAFAVTVRIGAFAFVGMTGVLLFYQSKFWEDATATLRFVGVYDSQVRPRVVALERRGVALASRLPSFDVRHETLDAMRGNVLGAALLVAVLFVLVIPGVSLALESPHVDVDYDPEEHIDDATAPLRVAQPPWTVFAPQPRTNDRYYVFPAQTEDGELWDVYNDRPLTYDRPAAGLETHTQYDTYRERFYMDSVRRSGSGGAVSTALAEYICEEWREERGMEFTHVNMYVINEKITLETFDDPENRERSSGQIHRHGCGDNPPRTFAPPDF